MKANKFDHIARTEKWKCVCNQGLHKMPYNIPWWKYGHQQRSIHNYKLTTPQPFYGLFLGSPGWAGARRELLDFMVQGKINRGRHTHRPAGRHSIRTNQCPPPPSPRACLDQVLIAIRSFTLLCNHNRSKTRLIAIMNLIAKLGIIYATARHASLCTATLDCLSVSCHCRHTHPWWSPCRT